MNGGILALILAGFIGFGFGAYLAATGEHTMGVVLMGMGLIFQILALRHIKSVKKGSGNAG